MEIPIKRSLTILLTVIALTNFFSDCATGTKLTGNKLNYADPHCARRLGQDMEVGISHLVFVISGSSGYNESDAEELAAKIGKTVRTAGEDAAKLSNPINAPIVRAIESIPAKKDMKLGELSSVVVWNGLRKLCEEEDCCYKYN